MSTELPPHLRAQGDQVTTAAREAAETIASGHLGILIARHHGDDAKVQHYVQQLGNVVMDLDPLLSFFVVQALGMMAAQAVITANGGMDKMQQNVDTGTCVCGRPLGHGAEGDPMPPDPFA